MVWGQKLIWSYYDERNRKYPKDTELIFSQTVMVETNNLIWYDGDQKSEKFSNIMETVRNHCLNFYAIIRTETRTDCQRTL